MGKSQVILYTQTGSQYFVDTENQTVQGGKLLAPIHYVNNPLFMKGGRTEFITADNQVLTTSIIVDAKTYSPNNEIKNMIDKVVDRNPNTQNIYVFTTRSGSNYIVNFDNNTITGGYFGNRVENIINNPNFRLNEKATVITDLGVVTISPIQNIRTYDNYKAELQNNLDNDFDMTR